MGRLWNKEERDMQTALRLLDRDMMDKQRALDAALGQIERAFGKGSIMKLGSREAASDIDVISTGSLGLDIALGIGGLPRGRVVEIYGPESSGKTTLALHVIAEAQKGGGTCAFIDAEHALDPAYARKLGVDVDNLLISQPDAGDQALEFYASVRLDIRRIGAIKDRDQVIGNQTRVKVVKNKMAPPFKVVDFDIMYGEGISKRGELIDLGVQAGVVEKSGAWFSYDGQRIGQGRENAKTYLKEHPQIGEQVEQAIRGNAGPVADAMMAASPGEVAAEEERRLQIPCRCR